MINKFLFILISFVVVINVTIHIINAAAIDKREISNSNDNGIKR